MKVLDPQSALLTNSEVYSFLRSNAPRPAEKQIGSYPATNLTGYSAVRKDFDRYTRETTPHVAKQTEAEKWLPNLVKRLKPYDLTKTEVLNLVNVGVGMRAVTQEQAKTEGEIKDEDEEGAAPDEEAEVARNVQFFKVCVEEAEERFPGEEGEDRMREVVVIVKEVIMSAEDTNGMNGTSSGGTNGNFG